MTAPRPDSRARGRASARENRNQTSWETITDALEKAVGPGRPSGAWTRYCCPAHEGDGRAHRPSLGVKYDTNQHRTVVRCFAGCQNEDVLAKVGLGVRDMFDHLPERTARGYTPPRRARQISRADRAIDAAGLPLTAVKPGLGQQVSPWKQVAVYPYTHADGTVAGEVIRREAAFERGRDKKFAQRAWTANGWADTGFEPIPFQLPQLLAAIGAGRTVAICEGEKDAVNAAAAGLTATTNAGGAAAWRPEHAAWLRGASRVLIVVDRDAPGYRRADRVLATLSGLGIGRIRVVAAREGKDLSDHLAAGHRLADLEAVPFLDPSTPDARARGPGPRPPGLDPAGLPVAEALTALTSSPFADSLGGTDMAFFQDAPPVHDDTVDHYSAHFSRASQQFMQQLLWIIAQITERSRLEAERAKNDEAARRALEAARAAEQKAIEGRLSEMAKRGWNRASRSEIATALRDAAVWSGDSELARRAQVDLVGHIRNRFGITLDMDRGTATIDASGMSAQLARAEAERAVDNRIATAGDRMVTLVAADPGIEESAKRHLYGEIEAWRRNPSGRSLDDLTRQVTAAGGKDGLRARLRFTATYLATPRAWCRSTSWARPRRSRPPPSCAAPRPRWWIRPKRSNPASTTCWCGIRIGCATAWTPPA
ncbi:hypothetical protein [Nocardia sp. IFM 10818]